MNIPFAKSLPLALIALLGFLPLGADRSPSRVAAQEEGVITGLAIKDSYAYGELLPIPEGSSLSYEGKDYPVEKGYLVYPDLRTKEGKSFRLDQYGDYRLLLVANEEGKRITSEKRFVVKEDYYSFPSTSDISYGDLNHEFVQKNYPKGLLLNLGEGDTFTLAKPINIYKNGAIDLIKWNVSEIEPKTHLINMRLTDCYDPSVYVDLIYSRGDAAWQTYAKMSAQGQRAVGVEKNPNSSTIIEGEGYSPSNDGALVHGNNPINGRYYNMLYHLDTSDHQKIRFSVDIMLTTVLHCFVAEFNNPAFYSYQFPGFKTGDVYLSITASNFTGTDKAPLQIAEIDGISGSDLLSVSSYEDKNAPLIELPTQKDSYEIVRNIPIRLPEARLYDDTGLRGPVKVHAYYNKGMPNQKSVALANGYLYPSEFGPYTIVYEAEDVFGNAAKKELFLSCVSSAEQGISLAVNPLADVEAGDRVRFDDYRVESLDDHSDVSVTVTAPNGESKTLSSPSESLLLEQVGSYSVHYSYSDTFYSGESSYSFTAKEGTKAKFSSSYIPLPKYLIHGASYSVDPLRCARYGKAGREEVPVKAKISFDGGAYQDADPTEFLVKGSKTMKFRFEAENDASVYVESEELPIVDTGFGGKELRPLSYFQGDFEGSASAQEDFLRFAPKRAGDLTLDFVNRILFSSFSLNLRIASGTAEQINLIFSDFYDPNNEYTVSLFSDSTYSLSGASRLSYPSLFDSRLNLFYDKGTFFFGDVRFALPDPFTTGLVNLRMEFKGAKQSGNIDVYQLCNQAFNAQLKRDSVAPLFEMKMKNRRGEIGEEVEVQRMYWADVLSPAPDRKAQFTASKTTRAGTETLKDVNGAALEGVWDFSTSHVFKIDTLGTYAIAFAVNDGNGVRAKGGALYVAIRVIDMTPPSISLSSSQRLIRAKAGEEITPLAVAVSDNETPAESLTVYHNVFTANGVWAGTYTPQEKIVLTEEGLYDVYATCTDEEGNSSFVSYQIEIRK